MGILFKKRWGTQAAANRQVGEQEVGVIVLTARDKRETNRGEIQAPKQFIWEPSIYVFYRHGH